VTPNQGPTLGELYLAETWIFGGNDPKPLRPCVVVSTKVPPLGLVTVYTRTTKLTVAGVGSDRDRTRGLTEPGVFAYLRRADWDDFVTHTKYLGTLDEPTMTQVYDMFDAD
jgi:hypothetical protein